MKQSKLAGILTSYKVFFLVGTFLNWIQSHPTPAALGSSAGRHEHCRIRTNLAPTPRALESRRYAGIIFSASRALWDTNLAPLPRAGDTAVLSSQPMIVVQSRRGDWLSDLSAPGLLFNALKISNGHRSGQAQMKGQNGHFSPHRLP